MSDEQDGCELPKGGQGERIPFDETCWTPRAVEVISTANGLASPGVPIAATDLLLALEVGDHMASRVLKRLAICPSATLARKTPPTLSPAVALHCEDFNYALRLYFPSLAFEEAHAMASSYLGGEHILLSLARIGVPGIDLPYDQIRQAILEIRKSG